MFHELIFLFIHECNCATVSDAIDTTESQHSISIENRTL